MRLLLHHCIFGQKKLTLSWSIVRLFSLDFCVLCTWEALGSFVNNALLDARS